MMNVLLCVGTAAILGFIGGKLIRNLKIPAVTGWVIMGVILGGSVAGIFTENVLEKVNIVSDLALGFIAFGIGEELTVPRLKRLGKSILFIVIFEAFGAFILVNLAVFAITHRLYEALVLGAISSATAPAATVMVLQEVRAKGDLTTTILSVVAIDDGIALILYAFASSFAKIFISPGAHLTISATFLQPSKEIFGALVLGAITGILISMFRRWISSRTDFFIVIVAAILLNLGLSVWLGFSELLACMSLGMIVANLDPGNLRRISRVWETATPVIYIAFFCLAGAHLNIRLLPQIGLLGLAYTGARMLGKVSGASLGARISKAPKVVQKYIGFSLFPQVGVALALAVVVGRDFAGYGMAGKSLAVTVINILLFTTIITEILGPYLTKWSLVKSGESRER
ncbi:cation:proton antiporter [Candidatus Aerophobetes bacterium]|nr:cation:proton antiporter [Candidatus Aerophobetes bacterium]